MADYAYKYNDIYDDYIVQAAPKAAPKKQEKAPEPELQRILRTRDQIVAAKLNKFKKKLAVFSLVAAAFGVVIAIGVSGYTELNAVKKELEDVNAAYQLSLEESNALKLEIDNIINEKEVARYAAMYGLVKIPEDNMRIVDVTPYQ